jgi:hypothetical protein
MGWQEAVRRLGTTVHEAIPDVPHTFRRGVVQTVTAGASVDGRAQVTVKVGGDTILAPYYASYTPAVGDLVDVRFDNGSPLITGHVVGLPTY